MINKDFELERLRSSLRARGIDDTAVSLIIQKADREIEDAMAQKMKEAMEDAIRGGVEKRSHEFINDIRPKPGAFQLETASGITDFSTPPFPMLSRLLKNAKPIKDGSGVYKIIPVGAVSNRSSIASNIFDAQKAIAVERMEAARRQYNKVAPQNSKTTFRTATSKQSQLDNWVIPAKEKDFTEDIQSINSGLEEALKSIVFSIIRDYEENF